MGLTPDNPRYLLIKTYASGRVSVAASSDSLESIEDFYLYNQKLFDEDIKAGLIRFDIYDICTEAA